MERDHTAGSNARPDSGFGDPPPFLTTHRATAVCSREVSRLVDAVRGAFPTSPSTRGSGEPEVQISPDRCVVQYGPVALTVGWLRRPPDTPDVGELLVMLWRGVIAQRGAFRAPERGVARTRTATVLFERSFVAAASDEASWTWRPTASKDGGLPSPDLAQWCVERLRLAHAEEMARVARMASA
jgi:hypothetical protein